MPAFDFSFNGAFDIGAVPAVVGTGTATLGLAVSIVNPAVFVSSSGYIRWTAAVTIGAVNVSSRLTGRLLVTAAEDAARVASFSVIPPSVAEMEGYEGQTAIIDVTLFRTGQTATYRLFTGPVERVEFDPNSRVAAISCRDGWQERPKACASAAEVEALLGGLASPSEYVVRWSESDPDPTGYFSSLLETLPGATAIDANGLWRVIPWTIGTAAASFTAADVFDGSVAVTTSSRADLPESVRATAAIRYSRLHSAEIALSWEAVQRYRYVVDGLPATPKSTVIAAIDGISGWKTKGHVNIVEPSAGNFPVLVGGQTVYYTLSPEVARTLCESFTATLYRRWYQDVEMSYTVDIAMGGSSGRDDSTTVSVSSGFESSSWESAPPVDSTPSLYSANPPPSPPEPPTGYEALPQPWPPGNGAVDYLGDITTDDLNAACRNAIARALRKASKGRRKRSVRFSRPLDPRWEIGAVIAVDAVGVSAKGQVSELEHEIDFDSAAVQTAFVIATPEGEGTTTGFSATVSAPSNTISHTLLNPALGNWVGASWDTPAIPNEDALMGFLCNVVNSSDNYDPTAPAYEPQFRIIMPEIPAAWRDPLHTSLPITASVSVAAGTLNITF